MAQWKIDHFEAVRGPNDKPGTGPDDSIQLVTVGGVLCHSFNVRPGDVQPWDSGNISGNGHASERAEISGAPGPDPDKVNGIYNILPGMVRSYVPRYRFKSGFPIHDSARHQWAMISQFAHLPPKYAGNPWDGFHGISVHDGAITFDTPNDPNGGMFYHELIEVEAWVHDFLVAVYWSPGHDGYVKVANPVTKKILARWDGATYPAGAPFMYGPKMGYYRAGGLPEGTVYVAGATGPLIDIYDVDMTVAHNPRNCAPLDTAKPSVNPNTGAAALIEVRNELVLLDDPGVRPQIDLINLELDLGPWTP